MPETAAAHRSPIKSLFDASPTPLGPAGTETSRPACLNAGRKVTEMVITMSFYVNSVSGRFIHTQHPFILKIQLSPTHTNASWVGLSKITWVGDGSYVVIERDNRTGDFAALKTLVRVDAADAADGVMADEKRVYDLILNL